MLHRIFIAINVPSGIQNQLLKYKNKWPEVPARWTTNNNLHVTLAFLGNTSDQELAEMYSLMKKVGERHKPFSLDFTYISYDPPKKPPRMIWVLVKKQPEFLALQKDVETALANSNTIHYIPEKRMFSPHLTLARLKTFELQKMDVEELPEINEEISLSFNVQSFEVMESKLRRSGAEYNILQTCPL